MTTTKTSGFIVTGTASGSGKTTITLGLMAALKERGLTVQPFKCGPDFIDPGLHRLVTGRISRNLDLWMMGETAVKNCYHSHSGKADIAVVEGVMGMYDGGGSSSAALAGSLQLPPVLVLDVRSMAESSAAIVKGFESLDPATSPRGVILNRIGSPRHLQLVSSAIKEHCTVEILGHLPRSLDFSIPSRHLGLLTGEEAPLAPEAIGSLSRCVADHINLERLLELAQVAPEEPGCTAVNAEVSGSPPVSAPQKCRIGIARDRAFCFYYEDNFDLLAQAGFELCFFSPLHDRNLPSAIDVLYLGGGYPELYGKELSDNRPMLQAIRAWVDGGGVTYAECGGFMYLTRGIIDHDANYYPLVGFFPVRARMHGKRASLGYRQITTTAASFFGPAGMVLRGHEFHYSTIEEMGSTVERIYGVDGGGEEGFRLKNTLGGYMHLHFGYTPQAVINLIKFCQEVRHDR